MFTIMEKSDRNPSVGRFSVDFVLTNHEDVIAVQLGVLPADKIRRIQLSGLVDKGSMRLVLPSTAVAALGLAPAGRITVQFADGRRDERDTVGDAEVEIGGRSSVFTAVVEPGRSNALIGAIVMEELDLIADCTSQKLLPRDPKGIFAELD